MDDHAPSSDKPKNVVIDYSPDGGVTWDGEPTTHNEVMARLKTARIGSEEGDA